MTEHIALIEASITEDGTQMDSEAAVTDHQTPTTTAWNVALMRDRDTMHEVSNRRTSLPLISTRIVSGLGDNNALECVPPHKTSCRYERAVMDQFVGIQNEIPISSRIMLEDPITLERTLIACEIDEKLHNLGDNSETASSLFKKLLLSKALRPQLPSIVFRHLYQRSTGFRQLSQVDPALRGEQKIADTLTRRMRQWFPANTINGRVHVQ